MKKGLGIAFALAGFFILSSNSFAQDVTIQVLVDQGDAKAVGGITLDKTHTASFDSNGNASNTAGFWKGTRGKLYAVGFARTNTSNISLIVEFRGTVRWGSDGKITETADEFRPTHIKTEKSNDQWLEVKSFNVGTDGLLKVTSNTSESIVLSGFSPTFRGATYNVIPADDSKK